MDTRALRLFRAVAARGSLSGASRELHLTPSALSHGLKGLESYLGTRLFDRVGSRLLLNQAGEQLLAQIEAPLAALDQAESGIRALARWGGGSLRVGASVTACQHILPRVFNELRKHAARVQLQAHSGDTPDLMERLRRNAIDVAVCVEPRPSTDLEIRPLFEDELLFVRSPRHPWVDGRPVSHQELACQPMITYQQGSLTSRMVEQYFTAMRVTPTSAMEISSFTAIKETVKLNLGVGIMAPWAVEDELAKGSLRMRKLGPRKLRRRWAVVHLKGKRLELAGERFYALCRRQVASMRLDRRDLPSTRIRE